MGQFKIEKDVQIPSRTHVYKYPFLKMVVGDSFFVKDGDRKTVGGSAVYWGRKSGFKFTTRTVDGGVRVWRYS